MFVIPNEHVTAVKADEIFIVSKMGHGRASLCGSKLTLDVPGEGLYLGMRFTATANNRVIPVSKKKPLFK
ncbi:hypothetical protein OBP_242 [Pseudomonas phage OBP]|uniref:hypothetical protein n=1 Tax=Pseudomonas phage OBP TaxID=1124849 RepID=UPI000240D5D6|nr:hypothetical protein OBP_242 [Pseudomonas phage OBP]AEV89679.1 hypothetical protein OBP_242 [Pseudomonas phage OBP]